MEDTTRQLIADVMHDRARGSLVAGAVGDALGYVVEFMTYKQIRDTYGPNGLHRYDLDRAGVARISDDTQMTLYTANGLLIDDIERAYLEWYYTQVWSQPPVEGPLCWLSKLPQMYSRRAPGNTCMSSLYNLTKGLPVHNDSCGCGGIMRVAPVGLRYVPRQGWSEGMTIEATARVACEAAAMTHQHVFGYLPAGLLAATIYAILERTQDHVMRGDGDTISRDEFMLCIADAFAALRTLYADSPKDCQALDELQSQTDRAVKLVERDDLDDEEGIHMLGEGWTGHEAWYIAIYAALRHFDSLERAIVAAINHSGDSDSTGAVCGNIMGAIHGYHAIPKYYIDNLELHDVLVKMADDLLQ